MQHPYHRPPYGPIDSEAYRRGPQFEGCSCLGEPDLSGPAGYRKRQEKEGTQGVASIATVSIFASALVLYLILKK